MRRLASSSVAWGEHLLLTAAGAQHPGAEQHVRLPDLIGELGFVLFVSGGGGLVQEQLPFGEPAGAQETIERGGRQIGLLLVGVGQGQMIQERGAGARRTLALESFEQRGGLRRDGAELAAILTRLRMQRGEAVAAIAERPLQERVHRDLAARGVRDVVEARGDFLRASRQLATRQRFEHQRGD